MSSGMLYFLQFVKLKLLNLVKNQSVFLMLLGIYPTSLAESILIRSGSLAIKFGSRLYLSAENLR